MLHASVGNLRLAEDQRLEVGEPLQIIKDGISDLAIAGDSGIAEIN